MIMNTLSIVQYLEFPRNVLFAAVLIAILTFLYKKRKDSKIVRFMLSSRATIGSIIAIIIGAMGVAFIPDFSTSVIFILILLFVLSNLFFVILYGYRNKRGKRLRFLLNHVGLWIALFAGFIGAADTKEVSTTVFRNAPTNEAFYKNGERTFLDYKLMLHSFDVVYSTDGTPTNYEARVIIERDTALLKVNHPYSHTLFENMYLTGYDIAGGNNAQYCTVQIVFSPWKFPMLLGIIMMMCGSVMLFIQGPKRTKL